MKTTVLLRSTTYCSYSSSRSWKRQEEVAIRILHYGLLSWAVPRGGRGWSVGGWLLGNGGGGGEQWR